MQDMNWKHWALVVLIAFGLFAQLLKHFPGMSTGGVMPWDSEILRTSKLSLPYSVKILRGRERLHAKTPVAASNVTREQLEKFVAANAPAATTFEHPAEKGAETKAAKKEEKCDPKNPKTDPKTGQVIACKKKKKKEKKEEEVVEVKVEPTKAPPSDTPSSINQAIDGALATGQIPPPIPDKPDDAFDSLENWQKRLLNQPDLAETKRFIDHYQRNLVTADIFYKVTQQMMEDPRTEMKSLGVLCASLTPSVVSFQLLATLDKSERPDSPARIQAEEALNQYGDMSKLSIVERVMRSTSASYATVVATQKLDSAARKYLTLASTPTPTPKQQATLVKNATYFKRFVAILQDNERSTDPGVSTQSKSTLAELQNLLTAANLPPDGAAPATTATEPPATDPNPPAT